jgi:hypothetical protein
MCIADFSTGTTSEDAESSEDEDEDEETAPQFNPGEKNSQLTVGHKNDRTFVVRGDKIGVFKHTPEGKLGYAATIKDLGFKKMKTFKPKHVSWSFPCAHTRL